MRFLAVGFMDALAGKRTKPIEREREGERMARVLITADLVPTDTNFHLFEDGLLNDLAGEELAGILQEADFIAMNLETPLCDQPSPIEKCGPCLCAPTKTVKGIKKINPYFFTLANNHVMDQGEAGLYSTLNALESEGIATAGAGKNLEEASKPFIANVDGIRIGFYCCAEHEFSIATENVPGANPYDPLCSFEQVADVKRQCDYVVVLYHGGLEHYRYPSPKLQKVFRKFVDAGADLVVAQHTHCIGCEEKYHGSTLVYGQGNFLFDHSSLEEWKTALVISLDLGKEKTGISYLPIVKRGNGVRMAGEKEKTEILTQFEKRSRDIEKPGFIEDAFEGLAREMEKEYLLRLYGKKSKSPLVRLLDKLTDYQYVKSLYPTKNKSVVRNVLECEAHNELAIAVMNLNKKGGRESNGK